MRFCSSYTYMTSAIFLHHRDLRHNDNTGLNAACSAHKTVYPVFVLTPEQTTADNPYLNTRSIAFMRSALAAIAVAVYEGDTIAVLTRLIKKHNISAVYENADYTPYAVARQDKVRALCSRLGIDYSLHEDALLHPMGSLLKADGTPYLKFTPFYNSAAKKRVAKPSTQRPRTKLLPDGHLLDDAPLRLPRLLAPPDYELARDHPALSTTRLSAHLHFGTISPRKIYWSVAAIRRELHWREFYAYMVFYLNCDYSKGSVTRPAFNRIKWKRPGADLDAWKAGRTGAPIVDAAMRELLATGYMHNRCRMIVAMYLIFNLSLHWSHGEKFFAQQLTDYDYANNLGGWLWCAGVETHSNDYFRAFAMPAQSKKSDPDCDYIYKWIPELAGVSAKDVHNWNVAYKKYPDCGYVAPRIVDLSATRAHTIQLYRDAATGR